MAMSARIQLIGKNEFLRSASALAGGTAAAQALTILALPFLTRLYSPEDFAILAVYIAILTMVQVVACLRLEIAIPLPENDIVAVNLLALSVLFAFLMSLLLALFILTLGNWFFNIINQQEMQPFAWLLPSGLAFTGLYSAIQYWSSRKSRFKAIARTRMTQSASGLVTQLAMGLSGYGAIGLLVGHLLMSGAGVFNLARISLRMDWAALKTVSFQGMRSAFGAYRRFPLYSTWEALANNAALQIPVLIISVVALGPEAGFLLLASRAIGIPSTLIGGAVAQVYLSRAAKEERDGRLPRFTEQVLRGLTYIGVPPLICMGALAPMVFGFVFGAEWERAGQLVAWMTPWFVLKLMSSPISMVFHVKMMQRSLLALTVFGLVLRVAAVVSTNRLFGQYEAEAYAISSAIFYFVLLLATFKIVKMNKNILVITLGSTALAMFPILLITGF